MRLSEERLTKMVYMEVKGTRRRENHGGGGRMALKML